MKVLLFVAAFTNGNAWTAQHEIDTCTGAYGKMGWARL
jgi:hypothetical protein